MLAFISLHSQKTKDLRETPLLGETKKNGFMFKALTQVGHASAVADHIISTGHNIKWDHFEILATGKSDLQCKIKETLLISDLKPSLNENIGSEKLFLY